ncbi:hypothetical protein MT487_01645 [Lachnospiraceae bacterium NSJ-171]|jgi:hypothetical protein|nr:hypothetical protein [Lachnospiraceae bacterium NSJ-171]
MWILVGDLCVSGAVLGSNPLYGVSGHNNNEYLENHMVDNKLRQQYRQAVDDLRIEFKKTYLYGLCEEVVKRLSKILR